jgi:hypothetical protein
MDPNGNEYAKNWRVAERKAAARLRRQGHTILNAKARVLASRNDRLYSRNYDVVSVDKFGTVHLTEVKFSKDKKRPKSILRKIWRAINPAKKVGDVYEAGEKIVKGGTVLAQVSFDAKLDGNEDIVVDLNGRNISLNELNNLSLRRGDFEINYEFWSDKKHDKKVSISDIIKVDNDESKEDLIEDIMESIQ